MTRTDDEEVGVVLASGHTLYLEWWNAQDQKRETVVLRVTSTTDRRAMLHIHGATGAIEAFPQGGGGMVLTALGA